jgi:CDP-diacylglycerol--glycerol-3-phosphate 3-phosphatidyltransferase
LSSRPRFTSVTVLFFDVGSFMSPTETSVTMTAPPERGFWNVPNSLTVARMVLAIAVFALIDVDAYAWALVFFIAAAITDALDGYFARLLKQDTPIGRQLDPLIDKVIVSGCYIYLATISGTGVAPWMVTVIVVRELLIQGLRSHLEGQGQAFGARTAGKLKTVVQCLSIVAILVVLALGPDPNRGLIIARDILTYLAVALTLYSGLSYVLVALPSLRTSR